ncbi:hypothetical protein DNH61_02615 [Paenibacillus sambharensis]|uniref:DUF3221 domain-containing protein n=1 Tax=Paenibacillus sambharensis TaxID=1803190 RepID=A0A2W1LF09_9BACL|nr:hypothetical protein [Paenibacillus sambharensis]PZD97269.1 hypothetical protein DNH61_02615 [Paenibacillus sambharensis]
MKFFKILILTMIILVLFSACHNGNQKMIEKETVEGFIIETTELNGETVKTTGYMKVNAITYIYESEHKISTRIRAIEDYYDIDGNYQKTIIFDNSIENNKMLLTKDTDEAKEEAVGPLTIHLPDGTTEFKSDELTAEQINDIREHVIKQTELIHIPGSKS